MSPLTEPKIKPEVSPGPKIDPDPKNEPHPAGRIRYGGIRQFVRICSFSTYFVGCMILYVLSLILASGLLYHLDHVGMLTPLKKSRIHLAQVCLGQGFFLRVSHGCRF